MMDGDSVVRRLVMDTAQADILWREIADLLRGKVPVFRYGDHVVATDGREVRLTQMESDLLAICARHRGHVVSYETIENTLWPNNADREQLKDTRNETKVIMCRANDKCSEVGIQLRTIHGLGLELVGDLAMDWTVR